MYISPTMMSKNFICI